MSADGTKQRYLTDDGKLRWERVNSILMDITDGYLSNIEGIEYRHDNDQDGLLRQLMDDGDNDVDPDLVGSRLLKSLSQIHGIAIDHTISGEPEEEILYRMSKFAPVASKLSDEYSMSDTMYRNQWHDDVIDICDAIRTAEKNIERGGE